MDAGKHHTFHLAQWTLKSAFIALRLCIRWTRFSALYARLWSAGKWRRKTGSFLNETEQLNALLRVQYMQIDHALNAEKHVRKANECVQQLEFVHDCHTVSLLEGSQLTSQGRVCTFDSYWGGTCRRPGTPGNKEHGNDLWTMQSWREGFHLHSPLLLCTEYK